MESKIDAIDITLAEDYADGKLLSGTATYKDGSTSTYAKSRGRSPDYKGGIEQFYNYLGRNIQYPLKARKNNIQGRVIAQFVIEPNGKVTSVKIMRSPDAELSAEAVRVLQETPDWVPGTLYGKPVRVQYTVPIQFSFSN